MTNVLAADVLRILLAVLYAILAGQIIWVLFFYGRVYAAVVSARGRHPKGMLPLHVVIVSLLYLALAGEGLIHHYLRVGQPADKLIWFNLVVFALSNYGVALVVRYEWLRHRPCKRVSDVNGDAA